MQIFQKVLIGLGSNLGCRDENLEQVVAAVKNEPAFSNPVVSSFYETLPVDGPGPDYLNAVIAFETAWSAEQVHGWLQTREHEAGRIRGERNAPRTLDLDLLFYGNMILDRQDLTVPHPRLHERAFVLIPAAEIVPDLLHPVFKKSVAQLLSGLSSAQLRDVIQYENHS